MSIVRPIAALTPTDAASSWRTPQWLVQRIREELGGVIDLDPCTSDDNPVGATYFYTPADDGLSQSWQRARTVFVNPPFCDGEKWAQRALLESTKPIRQRIIFLAPASVGTAWFHQLWEASDDAVFCRTRIRFEDANGKVTGSPTRGTVLLGINCSVKGLADLGTRAAA